MKLNKLSAALAFVGASMFSMTLPALAQGPSMPEPDHAQMSEKMRKHMQERMEKHRAMMHDQLKITAEQEAAWKTFTEATSHNMKDMMQARPDRKQMEGMSAPAMMEQHLERSKAHLATMQKHLDALKTFYAVLNPEQQKTFDRLHQRMHHRAKMMRMTHGMGQMHRPPMGAGHDMDQAMPKK